MNHAGRVLLPAAIYSDLVDTGRIDYDSGVPPYRQLAAFLRERIKAGELAGRLPGERSMAQEYDVAHGTVRKALALLRDEGLVETNQGWGSRVVPPEERGEGRRAPL